MFGKNKKNIKITGRAGLIYRHGPKVMKIDSEMLAGGDFDMVIYERSMRKWQPPYDLESISEDVFSDIKNDVQKLLKKYRIDWQA